MSELLREFGPAIWIGDGPIVSFLGFAYPTRMVLIKLSNGRLFVWSPIKLSAALKRDVDALGPVGFLVSPNRLHHLFLAEWKSAYPQARLCASPGLRKKCKDLAFDADLGDSPEPEWAIDIDQVPVRGSFITEVEFFHRASRTAIFADLIQNFPPDWFKGWRGWLARADGLVPSTRCWQYGYSWNQSPENHWSAGPDGAWGPTGVAIGPPFFIKHFTKFLIINYFIKSYNFGSINNILQNF